jgi:predicted Fe-Mo cluster-binding NifX family protein
MKIAISTSGETLESPVDPRFGRAARFILYDAATGQIDVVDNSQSLNAAQGAGIQAAEKISRLGAAWLITGHCGPKAFRTLKAAGIQIVLGVEGTVRQAIDQFKAGRLKPSNAPDVQGHW